MGTDSMDGQTRLQSAYGPVRTSVGWWAPLVANAVVEHKVIKTDGTITAGFGHYMAKLVSDAMATITDLQLKDGQARAASRATVLRLGIWMPVWGQFVACGQQLLDMDSALAQSLSTAPIEDDFTLSQAKPPVPAFYVRFGRQDQLCLRWAAGPEEPEQLEYVDGAFFAFVQEGKTSSLVIALTMVLQDGQGLLTPGYCLSVPCESMALPPLEALRAALRGSAATAAELQRSLAANPAGPLAGMGNALNDLGTETSSIFHKAWPLLVNTLAYLSGRELPALQASAGAPSALANKALKVTTGPARYRALEALYETGHTLLRPLVSAP